MARRALVTPFTHWKTFNQLYVEIFTTALGNLGKINSPSIHEDAISERLIVILREVCFNLNRSRCHGEIRTPIWEAPIPPVNENELQGGKKRKRPDFTCYYFNAYANSPDQQEIPFHVECKRLGSSTFPSWNLNENYVVYGIKRFDCSTHQYGQRSPVGMMIGYIINMTPPEIETEVNRYQKKHLPHCPDIAFMFDTNAPFKTHQHIQRSSVEPAQFQLIHLWADLR